MKLIRHTIAGLLVATLLASGMVLFSPAVPEAEAATSCNIGGIHIFREGPCNKNSSCSGSYNSSISWAKISYKFLCGEKWQYDSGFHKCAWSTKGWICWGP
jgi:hypothetical protein